MKHSNSSVGSGAGGVGAHAAIRSMQTPALRRLQPALPPQRARAALRLRGERQVRAGGLSWKAQAAVVDGVSAPSSAKLTRDTRKEALLQLNGVPAAAALLLLVLLLLCTSPGSSGRSTVAASCCHRACRPAGPRHGVHRLGGGRLWLRRAVAHGPSRPQLLHKGGQRVVQDLRGVPWAQGTGQKGGAVSRPGSQAPRSQLREGDSWGQQATAGGAAPAPRKERVPQPAHVLGAGLPGLPRRPARRRTFFPWDKMAPRSFWAAGPSLLAATCTGGQEPTGDERGRSYLAGRVPLGAADEGPPQRRQLLGSWSTSQQDPQQQGFWNGSLAGLPGSSSAARPRAT